MYTIKYDYIIFNELVYILFGAVYTVFHLVFFEGEKSLLDETITNNYSDC